MQIVTKWPGTAGPKALRIWFTCPNLDLSSWGDVLTANIGGWDDLQLFDPVGLFAYSVRHEGMILVRQDCAPKADAEWLDYFDTQGDDVDPSVMSFLTG